MDISKPLLRGKKLRFEKGRHLSQKKRKKRKKKKEKGKNVELMDRQRTGK